MPKDPAFLFYYQDFIFGTSFMTNEEVGAYIKVLCFLADKNSIKEENIKSICGSPEVFNAVIQKLDKNGDDTYHQHRLTEEVIKRRKYSESRRNNLKKDNTYEIHMDSHMENENEDVNVINKEKEQNFKSEVYEFLKLYPDAMLKEFTSYWTEPNKSKTKLRYELEKTWDLARRLNTWASRTKDFKKEVKQKPVFRSANFDQYLEDPVIKSSVEELVKLKKI